MTRQNLRVFVVTVMDSHNCMWVSLSLSLVLLNPSKCVSPDVSSVKYRQLAVKGAKSDLALLQQRFAEVLQNLWVFVVTVMDSHNCM
jgi:hypothetical protein